MKRPSPSRKAQGASSAAVPPDAAALGAQLAAALPPEHSLPALFIFGDGGCVYRKDPATGSLRSTGPGGYGTVLCLLEQDEPPLVTFLSGGAVDTTNNQQELRALIEGFKAVNDLGELLDGTVKVHAISDSQYVVKGITEWLAGWLRRKWAEVKNVPQWKELLVARGDLTVTWHHCRGHREPDKLPAVSWERFTALGNDAADRLATLARQALPRT